MKEIGKKSKDDDSPNEKAVDETLIKKQDGSFGEASKGLDPEKSKLISMLGNFGQSSYVDTRKKISSYHRSTFCSEMCRMKLFCKKSGWYFWLRLSFKVEKFHYQLHFSPTSVQ